MFLNVSKQTFHIPHVHISQNVKDVLMWNLQHIIFIWRRRYRQIFKSTDFHVKPYNCSSLLSIKNSIILRHGNNIMISVISHQEIVIQALSIPSYLDEELPCWFFLLLMLYDWFLNYFLLLLHPLMIWENIKSVK